MFSSTISRAATLVKNTQATRSPAERKHALLVQATSTTASGEEAIAYAKTLPGVSQPFPDVFDPAGFLNKSSVPEVRRWREAELVHGRVAMLASLGFIVGEQLEDFPLFDGRASGPAINQFQQISGAYFWEPLLISIGIAESLRVQIGWASPTGKGFNNLKDDYVMGDLEFDPLGLLPEDEEELYELKTKELNNGRLAMIAISAFVAQELVNGTEIFKHLFREIEFDVLNEVDIIEKDLGLPITPIPQIVLEELGKSPLVQ